ncbi:MAG: lamin tail domain-containing protein, partial [Flavisolibacter sp.]|nr:lamin tail domain-containing protein [Flavisolibacter sp.]
MKKFYLIFLFAFFGINASSQVNHLVISQVYGAGGNTGATYKNDFIEIFNPTTSSVNLTGWSVQYASATGSSWAVTSLSGSIAAGKYYLVQQAGGATGANMPAADATGITNMSSTAGKVALVNSTTALTGTCPSNYIDLVGFGTTANCYEGSGATPAPSAILSVFRAANGCTDTDNNASDFSAATPAPRNSVTTANTCSVTNGISTGNISTPPFCIAGADVNGSVAYDATGSFNTTFTAYLSDATGDFTNAVNIGSTTVNGTNASGNIAFAIPASTPSGSAYRIRITSDAPAVTGSSSSSFQIFNGVENVTGIAAVTNSNSFNLSWNNPTNCFEEVLVVVKQGSAVSGTPSGNGTAYTADNVFTGAGSDFDGGKVVYKGSGTSVAVSGLTAGQNYY